MDLPSRAVYKVLSESGVDCIYHANSVITACQFLRQGSLMSRGTIERKGLFQTKQRTDRSDKNSGIWFDVFVDSVDIHERASRSNAYGPVLFILDSKIIDKSYTGRVWVTKQNPMKWKGKSREERWFTSINDLKANFVRGCFDQMIVFRHCGGELSFNGYLKEIILDDPMIGKNGPIDYYSMAYGALRLSMTEGRIDVPISKRRCYDGCACVDEYHRERVHTRELYLPKI